MKRLLYIFLTTLLIPLPVAQASSTVLLVEPTHRSSSGVFFNDGLAESIAPTGRLGKLVFDKTNKSATWIIDPALMEEVADLVDGYTYLDNDGKEVVVPPLVIADIWLNTVKNNSRRTQVLALPYGNPSISFLNKNAPGELVLYRTLGQQRLAALLGRNVGVTTLNSPTELQRGTVTIFSSLRKPIATINSVVTLKEVEDLRLKLAQYLDPSLPQDRRTLLKVDLEAAVKNLNQKIRISGGNYTITSSRYELPITIINRFDQQVNLDVRIFPTNSRILVGSLPRVTVGSQSQIQIKVPITVIASGDTTLRIQLLTPRGERVGEVKRIPLRLAVISASTTWFATILALILLLAVVTQSVRRVKRRKEKR